MELRNRSYQKQSNHTFHMLLRSHVNKNSVFDYLQPSHRNKKYTNKSKFAPEITIHEFPVEIDFDEASKCWNENKVKLNNGMYKYKSTIKQEVKRSIEKSKKRVNVKEKKSLDYDNTISLRNRIVYEKFH